MTQNNGSTCPLMSKASTHQQAPHAAHLSHTASPQLPRDHACHIQQRSLLTSRGAVRGSGLCTTAQGSPTSLGAVLLACRAKLSISWEVQCIKFRGSSLRQQAHNEWPYARGCCAAVCISASAGPASHGWYTFHDAAAERFALPTHVLGMFAAFRGCGEQRLSS